MPTTAQTEQLVLIEAALELLVHLDALIAEGHGDGIAAGDIREQAERLDAQLDAAGRRIVDLAASLGRRRRGLDAAAVRQRITGDPYPIAPGDPQEPPCRPT